MIKVNSELLIWRYKKKYHHEIRGIHCIYGFNGEYLIRDEAKIKTLLWARGREIIRICLLPQEELDDGALPSIRSYRPQYVGQEDPNWNDKEFIDEAKAHYEERLEQNW